MKILVEGVVVNYRDEGNGPVLLMLHGWGSDLRAFNNLATWAKQDYRVVRLDLPGFGKTEFASEDAWGVMEYANFINQFLKKLEISKTDTVLGHSMGGRIAIYMASNQAVSQKTVLLAAHGLRKDKGKNLALMGLTKLGKAATFWLPTASKERLRRGLYRKIGASDYLRVSPQLRETFKKLINEDLTAAAQKISQPTLLVYGSKDDQTPPELGAEIADLIKGSKYVVVPDAGHYVHIDAFDRVVQELRDFL